jgi:isocitrate dehydrogenase (NAD+)
MEEAVSDLEFERHDLSLENGAARATGNQVVFETAEAVVCHAFGLKAATITPREPRTSEARTLFCAAIGGKVIIRSGRPSDMVLQLFGSIVANPRP